MVKNKLKEKLNDIKNRADIEIIERYENTNIERVDSLHEGDFDLLLWLAEQYINVLTEGFKNDTNG